MTDRVVVIGGYGVFGARISMALAREPGIELLVAGRDTAQAQAFCARHGGRPVTLDRDDPALASRIADLAPFLVIDAAGPFQDYGAAPYRLAEAALAAGAHYLDLSDDADFTAGIVRLDDAARAAGRTALSGVSSVPALSSAAVTELMQGLDDIHLIESVILPGNRAPRGLSVIRSIAAQAGRPLTLWRGGRAVTVSGWSDLAGITLSAPGKTAIASRWASLIGAPDLALFPKRFRARSVLFRAGLELKLMHGGLALLTLPVRWGLVRNLAPLAPALKWLAERLEPFGSDTGGMRVRVAGVTEAGLAELREWTLIAAAGDGPHVPAIPARVLCAALRKGEIAAGARACLAEFPLAAAETAMQGLALSTHRVAGRFSLPFTDALGSDYGTLPAPLRDLHTVIDLRRWRGQADITRGRSIAARLFCTLIGFPRQAREVPVEVTMERRGEAEIWVRDFGGRRFRSHLSRGGRPTHGAICERFGLLSFDIDLGVSEGRLSYPVVAGRLLGIPLPRWLLPVSTSAEHADAQGRACFDVAIALPGIGAVVHYRGWLEPDDA